MTRTQVSPLQAIRAKCLDCCGDPREVKLCTATRCPLHPFRDGKNPYRKKHELSEKQRAALLAQAIKNKADNSGY